MKPDITHDEACECFIWRHNGSAMCLVSETEIAAERDVNMLIASGVYPEDLNLQEGEEEVEYYDDHIDGDFDSGMASAGFGTNEDYRDYSND